MSNSHQAQNKQLSKNFNEIEFACKCCGQVIISNELVIKLQKLRDLIGKPIHINSGYRCPKNNKEVGGVTNSQHVLGTATDITISGLTSKQIAKYAEQIGFGGIGIYQDFIHVDVRSNKARWNG